MTARALAFFIWAAVAASVMFWGLRLVVNAPRAPVHTAALNPQAPAGDFSRLLGREPVVAAAPTVQAEASSRFRLVGVVAPKSSSSGEGLALISVDGKPARHYRVGAVVDGDTTLLAVSARGAELGPRGGPAGATLNLPPPPSAATGVLPNAVSGEAPAPPMPAPPAAGVIDPTRVQPVPPQPVPGSPPQSQQMPPGGQPR
ncbi:MAG TPA: type II secretion system protein N [Burkholderiaceae bacterium]|nr:type II secretion system protein N [Burkholderiaceae bacterium]